MVLYYCQLTYLLIVKLQPMFKKKKIIQCKVILCKLRVHTTIISCNEDYSDIKNS